MKGGFSISQVFAQFEQFKEVAALTSIMVRKTYEEACRDDPKFATFVSEQEYLQLVSDLYRLGTRLQIINAEGFLTPENIRDQVTI